jgi:hypothetical protein
MYALLGVDSPVQGVLGDINTDKIAKIHTAV